MKKKIVIRIFWIVILIIALIVIIPHVWHPSKDTYSIEGTVKSVNIVETGYYSAITRYHKKTVYVNFETTDGRNYNFHYRDDPSPKEEMESFNNLVKLSEGDKVELFICSFGYYFINSEKERVAIYVKDVKWLE